MAISKIEKSGDNQITITYSPKTEVPDDVTADDIIHSLSQSKLSKNNKEPFDNCFPDLCFYFNPPN